MKSFDLSRSNINNRQVGKGVGGLASGVWGGLSGKNQKQKDAAAAKKEAESTAEEGEEAGEAQAGGKGSFF